MKHILKNIALISIVACLAACATGRQHPDVPVAGSFERADANKDYFIDYAEFKNYVAYKASPFPHEREQVKEEARKGYLAHQKRFLALDVNNDGKLSFHELGGG